MRKGGLPAIKKAKLDVVSDVVLPGHDFRPRRGTDRVGETVGESDGATLGDSVGDAVGARVGAGTQRKSYSTVLR